MRGYFPSSERLMVAATFWAAHKCYIATAEVALPLFRRKRGVEGVIPKEWAEAHVPPSSVVFLTKEVKRCILNLKI